MKWIVIKLFVAFLFLLAQGPDLLATNLSLEERLSEIHALRNDTLADIEKVEHECLQLLDNFHDSSQVGKVYAELAFIYAQHGLSNPAKTILYCRKALEYPLDVDVASRMHLHLSDAFQFLHHNASNRDTSRVFWKEGVRACLSGMKFLLNQNLPQEIQELPLVSPFDYEGSLDDSIYIELSRKNQEQMAARRQLMIQNMLILHREALIEKCVYFYSRTSQGTNEFEATAREILGKEDAVRELLSRIKR
jgi:hypothetical protein